MKRRPLADVGDGHARRRARAHHRARRGLRPAAAHARLRAALLRLHAAGGRAAGWVTAPNCTCETYAHVIDALGATRYEDLDALIAEARAVPWPSPSSRRPTRAPDEPPQIAGSPANPPKPSAGLEPATPSLPSSFCRYLRTFAGSAFRDLQDFRDSTDWRFLLTRPKSGPRTRRGRRFTLLEDLRPIRSAASSGGSCSQTRMTVQPSSASRRSVSASRSLFRISFLRHHSAFARGNVACSGHECQKHPSTKTTTFARGKTTSARRLRSNPSGC